MVNLAFPLGLITWTPRYFGVNVDLVRLLGGALLLFYLLNSFLAATLIWYVLIGPIVRRYKKIRIARGGG